MMEVSLRIRGVDVDDDTVDQLISEHFSDALWSSTDQIDLVTIFVSEETAVQEAVRVAELLEAKIPNLKVVGVYRDLVGTSDIAQRAGVSREAVRKWALEAGFAAPIDYLAGAGMKVWTWAEVVEWLQQERGFAFEMRPATAEVLNEIENRILRSLSRRAPFLANRGLKPLAAMPRRSSGDFHPVTTSIGGGVRAQTFGSSRRFEGVGAHAGRTQRELGRYCGAAADR